jgi:hypothetical protein
MASAGSEHFPAELILTPRGRGIQKTARIRKDAGFIVSETIEQIEKARLEPGL